MEANETKRWDVFEIEEPKDDTYVHPCLYCLMLFGHLHFVTRASKWWVCREGGRMVNLARRLRPDAPIFNKVEEPCRQCRRGAAAKGEKVRRRILELLAANGPMSSGELKKRIPSVNSASGIQHHLWILRDADRVQLTGTHRAARWKLLSGI